MIMMEYTTLSISTDLRDDLNLLKEIHRIKTTEKLLRMLLDTQLYNEEFFERIREKVVE